MPNEFKFDVFLSHSAKDKAVVRPLAERLRADGLRVWPVPPKHPREGGFAEWVLEALDNIPAKIEEGLEHYQFTFQPSAFILQPFPGVPIKGSLAQFLHIKWLLKKRERKSDIGKSVQPVTADARSKCWSN